MPNSLKNFENSGIKLTFETARAKVKIYASKSLRLSHCLHKSRPQLFRESQQ
jgi:hypothetical protein